MTRLFLLITFFISFSYVRAQEIRLSESSEISLITIDPGNQLVDSFGHSAIRVRDDSLRIDIAFNYGMFDFDKPNFYINFLKGKMLYELGLSSFPSFFNYYKKQNRSVKEQVLNLNLAQKQDYINFLQTNAEPGNREYLYDYFFDNCATKLRDVSNTVLKNKIEFNYDYLGGKESTIRNLMHDHLAHRPWGKFGLDLALGSVIDKKASPSEHQYIPEYVFKSFENSAINGRPIINKTNILFQADSKEVPTSVITPLFVFFVISVLVLFITIRDFKRKKRAKWLDFLLFFITGLIGLVVVFLWFATDHAASAKNYNALWAFMPNLILAFMLLRDKHKPWIKNYMLLLLILLAITSLLFIFKVQLFSMSIIPILLLLGCRYLYLFKKLI